MRSKEVETAINNCKILIECLEKYKDTFYFTNEKAPLKASKGLDTLLAYIEDLEEKNRIQRCQLNDAFSNGFIHKDKIREMMKDCHSKVEGYKENYFENDYKEYLYRKLEELLEEK